MSTQGTDASNAAAPADPRSTCAEAAEVARAYVAAYNNRDLNAMLSLQDEEVVSYPSRLFGHQPHTGHAGVSAWWAKMEAADRWYEVAVRGIRHLGTDRVAVLGEIREQGEFRSPWAVLIRIRNGLIIESRSYLSDEDLLDELGVLR